MVLAFFGCSPRLSRFEVVSSKPKVSTEHQISRAETGDQGHGEATSAGYMLSKSTIGGSYLRRSPVSIAGGHSVQAGLYGNPLDKF